MLFASVPILAPLAVDRYFPSSSLDWHLSASEVLFFTFMISSIACGEVVELMYRHKPTNLNAWLAIWCLVGALWSSVLYAMNVQHTILNRGAVDIGKNMLTDSIVLAIVFLALGTFVQVAFHHAEKKAGAKPENSV